MLGKAFGCEPGHRIQNLASLSLKFPSYQMPWASTDVPAMMFADAVAVVVHCLHFAAVAAVAAVYEIAVGKMYAMLISSFGSIIIKRYYWMLIVGNCGFGMEMPKKPNCLNHRHAINVWINGKSALKYGKANCKLCKMELHEVYHQKLLAIER